MSDEQRITDPQSPFKGIPDPGYVRHTPEELAAILARSKAVNDQKRRRPKKRTQHPDVEAFFKSPPPVRED